MQIIKANSPEWTKIQKQSGKYAERLDYPKIKELLTDVCAEGDIVTIERPHHHYGNLMRGLERQGLKHKEHFKLKNSVYEEEEIILVIKL